MNEAIILCVGFSDLLAITLPLNLKSFDRIIVFTTMADKDTHKVCNENNVVFYATNNFYKNNCKFNKAAVYNLAFRFIHANDWVTLLDPDIIVSSALKGMKDLDRNLFYGARRKMIDNQRTLVSIFKDPSLEKRLKTYRGFGYGYFQMFNWQAPQFKSHIPNPYKETECWEDGDWTFRNRWGDMIYNPRINVNKLGPNEFEQDYGSDNLRCLPFDVLHLGRAGANADKDRVRFDADKFKEKVS